MKVYLTVESWISAAGIEVPFGAHDSRDRPWYRTLPTQRYTCVDCGRREIRGWKLGLKGTSAVCDDCVVLNDPHRRNP